MKLKIKIIKILRKYDFSDKSRSIFDPYKSAANDILALFEVQQKALQEIYDLPDRIYRRDGKWNDIHSAYCNASRIADKALEQTK